MDYYEIVAGQPAALARSATAVTSALADLDLAPWRTVTLGVVSMGAASNAGHALTHRLARHGRRAVSIDASDLMVLGAQANLADAYVFVTEGGRSREVLEAARAVEGHPRLALTNAPTAPIAGVVEQVVDLAHGEDSKVYTIGYIAQLQALGLLAGALDGADEGEDWLSLPSLVAQTLDAAAQPAAQIAAVLGAAGSVDFVGSGPSRATVLESALLFRESARIATAAHETYQYLHGPMECLTPSSAVVLFGDGREVELASYLAGRGVPTVLVTAAGSDAIDGLSVVTVPAAADISRAVLDILPMQVVAGELARVRGLRIDGFLYHQDDTKVGPEVGPEVAVTA